jgi:hypothetical protein
MADKKHVEVDLPKQQYLTVANEKLLNDSTVAQAETARKTSRISAITGLIIFSIAAAIPSKHKPNKKLIFSSSSSSIIYRSSIFY